MCKLSLAATEFELVLGVLRANSDKESTISSESEDSYGNESTIYTHLRGMDRAYQNRL